MPAEPRRPPCPAARARNAEQWGARVAMREKDLGIWQPTPGPTTRPRWRPPPTGCAPSASEGDRMAIIGDNRPSSTGPASARRPWGPSPCRSTRTPSPTSSASPSSTPGVRIVLAENQEQVDKVLSVLDRAPTVEHVVYEDPKGMTGTTTTSCGASSPSSTTGGRRTRSRPGTPSAWQPSGPTRWRSSATRQAPPATPKGVMLTHANLLAERGQRAPPGALAAGRRGHGLSADGVDQRHGVLDSPCPSSPVRS